ncbi:hypothetical protein K2X14_14590 [Acetobacter sp. TBRC 12305]|uniref:DUF6876 domain-containing protein n=1 Tax=Acetobacter garciniae TaxID=2817435 RepID=A0A939KR11_9PROT|nr:DUF6876 family protein [Acetobacter garciniae]MBO1326199.1 hypothetical protein [Acetobacter garciniae]MBX0346064.1 hypothetical protein [Acetobacter garciniae]
MSETLDTITPGTLAGFIGTTRYYRYLMGLLLTDGTHYLASHGAGWLLDIVASARLVPEVRRVPFEFWTLRVDKDIRRAMTDARPRKKAGQKKPQAIQQKARCHVWRAATRGFALAPARQTWPTRKG